MMRAVSAGALLIFAISVASARDPDGRYAANPLHDWFQNLKSEKGPCCADADGALVQDADWESKDGHYRVRINGTWVDVPDEAVIKEPNRDGRTIVWGYPVNHWGVPQPGAYYIRCFLPGAMT
jgi:hypothetical protein